MTEAVFKTVPIEGKDDSLVKKYGGGELIVGAVVVAVPVVLSVAGFCATGITGGSLAAKLMSVCGIANGGGVSAGGLVATLQSAGAAGLGLGTKLGIGTVTGVAFSYLTKKSRKRKTRFE